jgi:hypothetical protein
MAGGRWEEPTPADAKRWKNERVPAGPGAPPGEPQFHCEERRGPPLCTRIRAGCADLPSTDEGAPCTYDWDCQGTCTSAGCSRSLADSDFGCKTRCLDGVVVKMLCVD